MHDPEPEFRPVAGVAEPLAPGLRRVLAPNPSPMTFRGTNTYLVGDAEIAVIDPGPADDAHRDAILRAVGPSARVAAILVTHAHLDHSPLARALASETGAPVLAYGDARAGRSPAMQRLAAAGALGGGEGVDLGFVPDRELGDGAVVETAEWRIEAHHTPGHFGNHLSFSWGDILFTGDLVMGWASSLVSPPDGDVTDFMASLERLAARRWSVFHPGHGAPVAEPGARLAALAAHRRAREAQILQALTSGPADASGLAAAIYTDTPAALHPAAARNVLAHLIDLAGKNRIEALDPLGPDARFVRL
ncbi:Hydroxyacylglutathione hydrolase [Roseivivax jejudonensis]|uniref:Hydroxyacylglutathione hydrolase n=1 Tax=Roseivivax jejudonensis TaxID=1529041 RepID=A0A1X6Z0Z7_9RHOB|nr:MBL fold metallo-hydrolase [Roseivivax jejudonensis]SLN36789.1 Hydroxyacylglutathione hydrolase [Roseivivax jejudonensis]